MGEHLPILSGRDAARALTKAGYVLLPGRGKGSHLALHHPGTNTLLVIPDHRELGRGMLRRLIREAGLTIEQFRALL